MQPVPQELLKEYVQSQHFTSTADIMQAMKEMFRDVIQQVMEVELDEELGRERCQRRDPESEQPRNYRNGYSKKKVKTQLGSMPRSAAPSLRETEAGSDTLAESPARAHLSVHFHGCHPLQSQGRSSICDQGCLCGSGHYHGWSKRHPWCLDWRA